MQTTRPVYQRQDDLDNERYIFKLIELNWKCIVEKAEPFALMDGLAKRDGKLKALIEIKRRKTNANDYEGYMISAAKFDKLKALSKEQEVPAFLVVKFNDMIAYTKIEGEPKREMKGRYDRNDRFDQEECVFINMGLFKRL
jgi:hypothetical protein